MDESKGAEIEHSISSLSNNNEISNSPQSTTIVEDPEDKNIESEPILENDMITKQDPIWINVENDKSRSNTSHDSSFDIHNYNEDDLEVAISESDSDVQVLEIEEDFEDYQPLPPPKEIDPDKLYSLHPFDAPDPSHCALEQDEDCILLNDDDSYWWLVKRCRDGIIGFAPAELLETFPERLARLNSWKNEQNLLSRICHSPNPHELKDYKKGNKSVSFSEVINYAQDIRDDSGNGLDDLDEHILIHGDTLDNIGMINQMSDSEVTPTLDIDKVGISDELARAIPVESISTSSEDVIMDNHLQMSSASLHSLTANVKPTFSLYSENTNSMHPFIAQLYEPIFSQMDSLLEKLDALTS